LEKRELNFLTKFKVKKTTTKIFNKNVFQSMQMTLSLDYYLTILNSTFYFCLAQTLLLLSQRFLHFLVFCFFYIFIIILLQSREKNSSK